MRKLIKNQLLEIMQSIYEAIELCKKQPDINVLADCQNAAVIIGEKVEETEGEDTAAVFYLEEFTDLVYNAGLVLDDSKELKKALNKSRDKLRQAENEIKNKIPPSYEILFLPYKASMWDALDSICKEAIKQENCHVTVMPSPYFNINPQGQILSIEYEGEQFPSDISITNYDAYNIPAVRPDVIFIHNPYDDCNVVTRLPEDFYSSELAKHTDRLVYVPYFVNVGSTIREHYCQMPAVRNAWRTFVHSDNVRNVYCKFNPLEKIVALGSPKFDMVVNYENNKPELPEEWAKVFEGKKVFLYNTHLRNIIGHAEKMIDKLEYVFSVFEKRDDVALLWRPHPLSIQTAKSMSPYILEKYMALIKRFKKLANGVYDDTSDIHRAIAVSDAYIGDQSSIVSMYGVTGKPMYIIGTADVDIDDLFDYVLSNTGFHDGDDIYTFSNEYNAFIHIKNGIAEYICSFENSAVWQRSMYIKMFRYDNEIVFIPCISEYVARYNMDTHSAQYYRIDIDRTPNTTLTLSPIVANDCVYMPTYRKDSIVKYDLKTNKIKCFDNILGLKNADFCIVFNYSVQYDNFISIACASESKIVKLDTNDDSYKIIDVPIATQGYVDLSIDGNDIYLLTNPSRDIWKWNISTNEIVCILKNSGAERIHLHKNKLFVTPRTADKILVINTDTLCIKEMEYPMGFRYLNTYKTISGKDANYEICGNTMRLYPRNANMYLELNMDTCEISGTQWTLSEKMKSTEFKNERRLNFDYTYLEGRCTIEDFISKADNDMYKEQRKNYLCKHIINSDGSAGKNIWEYVYKHLRD